MATSDNASAATGEECVIEATVPTGFETVAAEEVKEKLQTQCTFVRGRITFRTSVIEVTDILKLGGIDHCRVQILHIPCFGFSSDPVQCLSRLQTLAQDCQWTQGLDVLSRLRPLTTHPPDNHNQQQQQQQHLNHQQNQQQQQHNKQYLRDNHHQHHASVHHHHHHNNNNNNNNNHHHHHIFTGSGRDIDRLVHSDQEDSIPSTNILHPSYISSTSIFHSFNHPCGLQRPKFRVTCHRTGKNHSFDSMAAAGSFGQAVQAHCGWDVDLNHFDVEVVLRIDDDDVSVSLSLTSDSLHRRDMAALGVTSLRPTIACNMLRMLDLQPGNVVCDPLCGTSSIPIQGALRFGSTWQLCGDSHHVAMEKSLCNIDALNAKQASLGRGWLMLDALRWDACRLPLRDGVVDAFVTDLPFGKRVGRRSDNCRLYRAVLQEMGRCSKPQAKAALLTADLRNMAKVLRSQRQWGVLRRCGCNIGGLAAAVFLLQRASLSSWVPGRPRRLQDGRTDQN